MAKDAYPFLAILLTLSLAAGTMGWFVPAAVFALLAAFVAFFFRDPERVIPTHDSWILSPADGKVVRIEEGRDEEMGAHRRVSIFLSVFNVHINRAPIPGTISEIRYYRGKYIAAFRHEASTENERNSILIRSDQRRVRVTQIAGLIARRIICWKSKGDSLSRGERYGLIRFGSRVDLDLPLTARLRIKIGEAVHGGTTIIGEWLPPDKPPEGDAPEVALEEEN